MHLFRDSPAKSTITTAQRSSLPPWQLSLPASRISSPHCSPPPQASLYTPYLVDSPTTNSIRMPIGSFFAANSASPSLTNQLLPPAVTVRKMSIPVATTSFPVNSTKACFTTTPATPSSPLRSSLDPSQAWSTPGMASNASLLANSQTTQPNALLTSALTSSPQPRCLHVPSPYLQF